MNNNRRDQLISYLIKAGSVLVVIYALFLLGKSVWTNYDLRQTIKELNGQIATLEEQKTELNDLNLYYSSDAYKELEARRELGMKLPDEKVAIVGTTPTPTNFSSQLSNDQSVLKSSSPASTEPNWHFWWDYFTK
jgi:cell division protein FtsB